MKILTFFIVIMLSISFAQNIAAQDDTLQRGGKIKAWRENRKAIKQREVIQKGVTSKLDVPYLNDNDPLHTLDIYFPAKKDERLTVLVHIHGGGWKVGDKKLMKTTGMFYASHGILFITPNYRLSPKVKHPAHVEDCAAAMAWVFEHLSELGGENNRIFLSGHSAGAHLAALLGTNRTYLQKYNIKADDLSGIIPVDTASFNLLSNENERMVKKFIKQAFGKNKKVLVEASPFSHINNKANYPEFLIFNTTNRKQAVEGAKKFVDKLKASGCDVKFIQVNDHTHKEMAMGMYDASDPVGSTILKFILQKSNT